MPEESKPLDDWAIVELFGHKKLAGKLSEHVLGSAVLIRIDVPETKQEGDLYTKPYTKLVGPGSVYCITPVREEIARIAAQRIERWNDPIPVDVRPEQPRLAASTSDADIVEVDDDDDDDQADMWKRHG